MRSEPTVSVVICTRFRPAQLLDCLRSIAALDPQPDELIIVDNSSGDKQTEAVARDYGARYLVEPTQGLSRARNLGLMESQSEIVAYLDDDTSPEKDWVRKISEPFADSRVAVVTGRVMLPGQNNHSDQFTSSFSLDNQNPLWFEMAVFGGLGAGCNMAFRKSVCNLPKMFDERLGRGAPYRGGEEHLAFAQLLSSGHMAVYLSTATVHHFSENPMVVAPYLIAYVLLLASEFPKNRIDLCRYFIRRLQRKPLSWTRDAPDPGELIQSSWSVWLKAAIPGAMLYLRTKR